MTKVKTDLYNLTRREIACLLECLLGAGTTWSDTAEDAVDASRIAAHIDVLLGIIETDIDELLKGGELSRVGVSKGFSKSRLLLGG